MEAEFNMHNKLIFGERMLDTARSEGIVTPEHYSDKQSTAKDGIFEKLYREISCVRINYPSRYYQQMKQIATTECTT